MIDRNMLGTRGEIIFCLAISQLHEDERPLFRPVILGDKWPAADLAVELADEPGMFFLVQVKTGRRGYTSDRSRLLIAVDQLRLQKLSNAPLPTYLVGVDEPGGSVFLAAIFGELSAGRSSISVSHSVKDVAVHRRLYNEVKEFWSAVREHRPWNQSQFADL